MPRKWLTDGHPDAEGAVIVRLTLVFTILMSSATLAEAADYAVRSDGSGDYRTVQACADAARAGDTCLVAAGAYSEYVTTKNGGTSDTSRITFRAQGVVTLHGFDIRHPYVSIEGFSITGYSSQFAGHITIREGGSNCRLVNNTVRDGALNVYGIYFYSTRGQTASNCVVRGNRLSNLNGHFFVVNGNGHLFETNTLEYQNSRDYIRLFGAGHVFRRNVFWRGTTQEGTGNHPDFVQTFGGELSSSENHLFEENWLQDLPSQFSQIISGDGTAGPVEPRENVNNVTFRRNIIANISSNANIVMPGVRFENNTFYRLAYELSGIIYSGSMRRGDGSRGILRNNIFLAGGSRASNPDDSTGFYALAGASFSREVICIFVTNERDASGNYLYNGPMTVGIFEDLRNNGYIDGNGRILAPARALTAASQLILSSTYSVYRTAVYEYLTKTVRLDESMRTTFSADYNYVAGAASAGFPAKRDRGCDYTLTFTDFNFCEPHGINGGDPGLQNLANLLGPDGIPFTLDDGLKPRPSSRLCGKGEGGVDIGAYSCDPARVFSGGGAATGPTAPANLQIIR